MRAKTSISTWNSYHVQHTIAEQSLTVIVLTKQTRISHHVHVYNMIKLFDTFHSVSNFYTEY